MLPYLPIRGTEPGPTVSAPRRLQGRHSAGGFGDRPGQVFRHTCDRSKAEKLLDWRPRISFEDGLDRTIEWYRQNEPWWRPQMWMRNIPIVTLAGKRELH